MSDGVGDHPAATIRPIDKGVVHRICAGQVILNLSSAVKELVENSLDAGATTIEISLKDYGEASFQVTDNGCGISPNNSKVLALKHHTSKLSDFPDLQSLTTFGFRGEALSSLCALGDLTVETRTKNEAVAMHLTFDHSGKLVEERKIARRIGTTVTVKKLFSTLPVRGKEFHRNKCKEYGKLVTLLNAYALIAKGVRLVCSNAVGKGAKSVVLKTQGSRSLKDNIITVFGVNTFACLEPLQLNILDGCTVDGFLSKPGHGNGRSLGDRQFFFVNGRPVDMPKLNKLVNELYRSANSRQFPIAIMNFTLPPRACDVNVSPDKRKIFFSDEVSILQSLREALENIYSPNQATYAVQELKDSGKKCLPSKQCTQEENSGVLTRRTSQDDRDRVESSDKEQFPDTRTTITEEKEDNIECPAEAVMHRKLVHTSGKDFILRVHTKNKEDIFSSAFNKKLKDLDSPTSNHHLRTDSSPLSKLGNDSMSRLDSSPLSKLGNDSMSLHNRSGLTQSSLNKFVTANKRKHDDISMPMSEVPLLRNRTALCHLTEPKFDEESALLKSPLKVIRIDDPEVVDNNNLKHSELTRVDRISDEVVASHATISDEGATRNRVPKEPINGGMISVSTSNNADDMSEGLEEVTIGSQSSDPSLRTAISGRVVGSTLQFSFNELITKRQLRLSRLNRSNFMSTKSTIRGSYTAAALELSQPENEEAKSKALDAAISELERLFKKEDFGRMKVIGQFNLGFIIGKLDQDLFIVDQHAADEKYNYERLSQTTVLNQQPLLRPLRMDLSPEEEIIISMHMGTIRKNGFSLEEDVHASPGQRFMLKAVPFSKRITFGIADVKELLSILADSNGQLSRTGTYLKDTSDSVCPPRVRAMLALRACKSSIMIGDPLGKNEMQKILEHLSGLKSPWNCPHGRPTMRHLVDITTVYRKMNEGLLP